MSDYNLPSKKTSKYYFNNPVLSSLYLFISTIDINALNNLKIKIYGLENQEDEDTKVENLP